MKAIHVQTARTTGFFFLRVFLPYKRFRIFRFWNVFSLQDRDADGFSIFKSMILSNCLIYFTYLFENLAETAAFYRANQDESSYWSTEKLINHLIVDSHSSEWQVEPFQSYHSCKDVSNSGQWQSIVIMGIIKKAGA